MITQRDLARKLKIDHRHLNGILTATRRPSIKRARKIEDHTGIGAALLLLGTRAKIQKAWKQYQKLAV